MQRISAANATAASLFQDANPANGQKATSLNAEWCNGLQEEMISLIGAGGIAPEPGVYNQVLMAIVNFTHAVGDLIWTANDQLSPGERYPWQTWVELTGVFVVARDTTQAEFNATGKNGGSKQVQLTGAQVGQLSINVASDDGDAQTGSLQSMRNMTINGTVITNNGGGNATVTPANQQAFVQLPPYVVRRCWQRTA